MKIASIEKTDIGATLTTWAGYCAMWQLHGLHKIGCKGYINWPQDRMRALHPYWDDAMFSRVPNMFDWYFVQPDFPEGRPGNIDFVWTWEHGNPVPELGNYCLMGEPLANIKAFVKQHLKLNDAVNRRGDTLTAKYNIDYAKTIGISWRGTDCVTDGRPMMPIQTYFPFIDDFLEQQPDLRLACTAEEDGILDPLLARYPNAFRIEEFISAPRGARDNPEKLFTQISGYERGMVPALMLYVFSRCAYYIKNRSSCAATASWMSDGKIVSLAHPENLGHGFDLTKAEIDGRLVPLNRPYRP